MKDPYEDCVLAVNPRGVHPLSAAFPCRSQSGSGVHRGPFEDRERDDGTIDLVCLACGEVAHEGLKFRTAEGLTVEVCRQNVKDEAQDERTV
jgi:hypothetical protein